MCQKLLPNIFIEFIVYQRWGRVIFWRLGDEALGIALTVFGLKGPVVKTLLDAFCGQLNLTS